MGMCFGTFPFYYKTYSWKKFHKIKQEVTEREEKKIMANKLYSQGFDWNGEHFSGQSIDGL